MNQLAIGVDIGGTRSKYGLVNINNGQVLHAIVHDTEKKSEANFLKQIGFAIQEFNSIASQMGKTITGIGFGVPGFVFRNGVVDSTYNFLEFMENFPLVALIEKEYLIPCRIDNDARVVALGEALYGKGKGFERVLVLTLGTGLGLGFVVDGRFTDELPFAHMGGHMKITENGVQCYCGKTGCLEALVSGPGILSAAKEIRWNEKYPSIEVSAESIFKAAKSGNSDAQNIVNELINYLKTGIYNYVNLFAAHVIVLGGGIAKGLAPYIEELNTGNYLKPFTKYTMEVTISDLQEEAGILGAAALFLPRLTI